MLFRLGRLIGRVLDKLPSRMGHWVASRPPVKEAYVGGQMEEFAKEVRDLKALCLTYKYPWEKAYEEYNRIIRNNPRLTMIQAVQETKKLVLEQLGVSN